MLKKTIKSFLTTVSLFRQRKRLFSLFLSTFCLLSLFLPLLADSSSSSEKNPFLEEFYPREDKTGQEIDEDSFQSKFFHMLFILTLLIGFMILASWLLKRLMRARLSQVNLSSEIKILETRQLSPKSLLYLVKIKGKKILIAESQSGITYLSSDEETNQEILE